MLEYAFGHPFPIISEIKKGGDKMKKKMLAAVAAVVLVLTLAMALTGGSTSAETDNYVQVYISVDADRVDIYIEGSNLGDELAIIDEIGNALSRLIPYTCNINYHVNELDATQKQEMTRRRDIEAELEGNKREISRVEGGQGSIWQGLSELGRGLSDTQVVMLCLFAIGICFLSIAHSVNRQRMWRIEDEQDALKRRVAALENKLKEKKKKTTTINR